MRTIPTKTIWKERKNEERKSQKLRKKKISELSRKGNLKQVQQINSTVRELEIKLQNFQKEKN